LRWIFGVELLLMFAQATHSTDVIEQAVLEETY